jgi:Na+-driven multidrug efflux pump
LAVSALLFSYWLFFKKDTYLRITFRDFNLNKKILGEILKVGIPSSLAQLSMSLAMIILNKIVIKVGGTDGIAVFTIGWRIVMLGVIPLTGIATGVVSVTGAAYGADNREKLKTAFFYAIKLGLIIEFAIGILVAIFARPISHIFTYSEGSAGIFDNLVTFLRIISLLYPTVPMGMLTSAMFRGIGHGGKSLIVTLIRTIILQIPVAYLLGIVLKMGLTGIWLGIIAGNMLALVVTFSWGIFTINRVALPSQKQN